MFKLKLTQSMTIPCIKYLHIWRWLYHRKKYISGTNQNWYHVTHHVGFSDVGKWFNVQIKFYCEWANCNTDIFYFDYIITLFTGSHYEATSHYEPLRGGSWSYPHIKISHPAKERLAMRHMRGVHSLFFSNGGMSSFTSYKNQIRRGSGINTERFPKRGPKAQASGGRGSRLPQELAKCQLGKCFLSLKIYLLWKSWPISVKRWKPVWIRSGRWVKALWDRTGLRFFVLIREGLKD